MLRTLSAGLVDQIALRSAALDEALLRALDDGVSQVALLGAGLDARAYRLDTLARARVFEIDHPATQRYKVARLGGLVPKAGAISHLAVDLSRDDLGAALASAGHDAKAPTFWLCEGVTIYLSRAETRAALAALSARSCPGSTLALTYMRADAAPPPAPLRWLVDATLRMLGEPLKGSFTSAEIAALAAEAGFVSSSDEGAEGWARRLGRGARAPTLFRREGLLVATKG